MAQATLPQPLHGLTSFQRDLLVESAALDAPSGLDIMRELEEHYEEKINHGRLYPNLDVLVNKGLVEKSQKNARTNEYSASSRGVRELRAHNEWEQRGLAGGSS